jgi:hypothetical protein
LVLILGLPILLIMLGFFTEDEKVYMRKIISRFRA